MRVQKSGAVHGAGRALRWALQAGVLGLLGTLWAAPVTSIGGKEPPRAARSVHLHWPALESEAFYNEMIVEQSTTGSYFMACGWNGGYFGIQEISPTRKVAIFSVWDTAEGDDPGNVRQEERVELLEQGEGVRIKRFGGEGTGGQCMLDWPWESGKTNRFLVRARSEKGKTTFAGYIYDETAGKWRHLVTFRRRGESHLAGLYSFVEDFRRDHQSVDDTRRAAFQNPWVQTLKAGWQPVMRARFTASRADWEARDNINAGTNGPGWFLATGGPTRQDREIGSFISAPGGQGGLPTNLPSMTASASGGKP